MCQISNNTKVVTAASLMIGVLRALRLVHELGYVMREVGRLPYSRLNYELPYS